MYSRRDFGKIAAAALPLSAAFGAKINSKVNGVQLGAQSYSYRDLSLDDAIKGMVEDGVGACELFAGHVEPPALGHAPAIAPRGPGGRGRGRGPQDPATMAAAREAQQKARETLREWRKTVDLSHFRNIRKQFDTAGIQLLAYNYSFNTSMTDDEIERGFARPLRREGSGTVREARELRGRAGNVEALSHQSRYRPLHRRQLRPG
jgi:hypothetical protein